MYTFLPDEILKEILTPALLVSDVQFTYTGRNSPFARYSERNSSEYLLVCKDWLRVATPLLYNVVILRSKGQIQALEWALKSTSNLGSFIRKIRIEGGYCPSLHRILKASVNLTHLCLSLAVYSYDTITGITKGLQYVQPQRVIVYRTDFHPGRCQNRDMFAKVVIGAITNWTRLREVVLSFPSWPGRICRRELESFVAGLKASNGVTIVRISGTAVDQDLAKHLLKIPKVCRVCIEHPSNKLVEVVRGNAKLSKIIVFVSPKSTPNEKKKVGYEHAFLQRFVSLPNNILSDILSFAMGNPELQDTSYDEYPASCHKYFELTYRRQLALICKKFYEIIVPLYYQCMVVKPGPELESLSRFLSVNPKKGKLLKTIFIVPLWQWDLSSATGPLRDIFTVAPNLQRIAHFSSPEEHRRGYPMTWKVLEVLSSKAGQSLHDLELIWRQGLDRRQSLNILTRFQALKTLAFDGHSINFSSNHIARDMFLQLEFLSCISSQRDFLSMMSLMDLPNLKEARFPVLNRSNGAPTFLRKHGHKLETLEVGFVAGIEIFEVCCNLVKFILPKSNNGLPTAEFFSSLEEHPLEHLHIKTTDVRNGRNAALMERFGYLDDVDFSNFTSLYRITVDYARWPATEHAIRDNALVRWAEHIKKTYDIDVYDGAGQVWVPRIKPKKKRGRK